MSGIQKLIERMKTIPKDFTFDEARKIAAHYGYEEDNKGRTSGSRVQFYRPKDGRTIMLHKPHPQKEMKKYAVEDFVQALKGNGDLYE